MSFEKDYDLLSANYLDDWGREVDDVEPEMEPEMEPGMALGMAPEMEPVEDGRLSRCSSGDRSTNSSQSRYSGHTDHLRKSMTGRITPSKRRNNNNGKNNNNGNSRAIHGLREGRIGRGRGGKGRGGRGTKLYRDPKTFPANVRHYDENPYISKSRIANPGTVTFPELEHESNVILFNLCAYIMPGLFVPLNATIVQLKKHDFIIPFKTENFKTYQIEVSRPIPNMNRFYNRTMARDYSAELISHENFIKMLKKRYADYTFVCGNLKSAIFLKRLGFKVFSDTAFPTIKYHVISPMCGHYEDHTFAFCSRCYAFQSAGSLLFPFHFDFNSAYRSFRVNEKTAKVTDDLEKAREFEKQGYRCVQIDYHEQTYKTNYGQENTTETNFLEAEFQLKACAFIDYCVSNSDIVFYCKNLPDLLKKE